MSWNALARPMNKETLQPPPRRFALGGWLALLAVVAVAAPMIKAGFLICVNLWLNQYEPYAKAYGAAK